MDQGVTCFEFVNWNELSAESSGELLK